MISTRVIESFLSEVPIFSALDPVDLGHLAGVCEVQQVNRGKVLFSPGDGGDRLFLVLQGLVVLERPEGDGRRVRLGALGPKQAFGHSALFGRVVRQVEARAAKSSLVLTLSRGDLATLVRRHPEVALRLLAWQDQRLSTLEPPEIETERPAGSSTPPLADVVAHRFPHPVAIVFQEMVKEELPVRRLARLFDLLDVLLLYLASVSKALYLTGRSHSPSVDAELLESRGTNSPAGNYRLLRALLGGVETDASGLGRALRAWFDESRPRPAGLLDRLVRARRTHGPGESGVLEPDHATPELLEELSPAMMQLLAGLTFLDQYPVLHIRSMEYSEGTYRYAAAVLMGAFHDFPVEHLTLPRPLETHTLALLARASQTVIPLSPWLRLTRCEVCGNDEIFLTAEWSGRRLVGIEPGRGHRWRPRQVPASLAELEVGLLRRVAEAEGRGEDPSGA